MKERPILRRGADISACGRYRFSLSRDWGRDDGPRVCFVMLNPSTADASEDDPTIRRCIGFAQQWGAHGLTVVNLFAWRATDPHQLIVGSVDKVGEGNNDVICHETARARLVVAGWGSPSEAHVRTHTHARAWHVSRLLRHRQVMCLGTTKDGMPRHPLYLAASTALRVWEMPLAKYEVRR